MRNNEFKKMLLNSGIFLFLITGIFLVIIGSEGSPGGKADNSISQKQIFVNLKP